MNSRFSNGKIVLRLEFVLIALLCREGAVPRPAMAGGMPESEPTGQPALVNWKDLPSAFEYPAPGDNPKEVKGSFSQKIEDPWGGISSKLEVHDFDSSPDNPLQKKKCNTEEAVRMTVSGPLYVFGQVGTSCESMDSQELKITSRTGLGWKVQPWSQFEVLVRGGHCVTCDDPIRPIRVKEESDLFLELQCRCPLPGKLNLEYQSTAFPALNISEHDRVNQDLRLAFPLWGLGQFRVGAKHSWENAIAPRPWAEGMELYVGLDLKR
jgi:hypothetical protein